MVCLLVAGHTGAEPKVYRAEYDASFKGLAIQATGLRKLEKLDENQYLLSASANNFLGSVTEQTLFTIDDNGGIKPLEYQYHRRGLGSNRDAILSFDWERNQVLNDVQSTPWRMDIPDTALDKLLYQFKVRQDLKAAYKRKQPWPKLSYDIADGGRIKRYHFEVLGKDVTTTPAGTFQTIKVTRTQDDDRTTIFWLAPDYEFLPIRLRLFEDDNEGLELTLKKLEFDR
ncbi:MAG: DUF3108 domain-containing protein [Pseudomonadales bacterium]